MRRIILESPFAGDLVRNAEYLNACIRDALDRGDAPFASHRLYTDALDDSKPSERALGINAGFAWRAVAEATVVYLDLGISRGMQYGIDHARSLGHPIEERRLGGEWASREAESEP
jgi:hypothetical protein